MTVQTGSRRPALSPNQARLAHAWRVVRATLFLALPLTALGLLAYLSGEPRLTSLVSEAYIYVVLVVGLAIFTGNSGIVSFGHVSFALIGAYASAWQTCCGPLRLIFMPDLPAWLATAQVPLLPAALIAASLAALVAFVLGLALMRLSGTAASIALLSMLFVFKSIYENWTGWTAGQSAIVGLPTYITIWVAIAGAVFAILIATAYRLSSYGLRLRAVREDEAAARASGVNAWAHKLIAFTISGFVAGLGGVLYGHFLGTITANMFWLDMTFLTLAMLVVGGMRSISGAVVGVLFVVAVREFVQLFERGVNLGGQMVSVPEGSREIVLAIILLGILVFRPQGLVGDREFGERK
ncbi:branched-chain amino acid ABC transporter permease [Aureimonas fodinaquatilis]|uniref:Branched-chain amino acid ABC transporter permease n=1 Tax=Aureimonas fodinaquatilis TaxID=2565783 RepID=A0A5B0E0L5_9HYPH|nr:branched-chain amino acid ABC transporter permease [Aureimonas fodinaquatilis]KAA0972168.1 branched-chain amino acid ABC transporter permease [Aureimonas fodinaquatilis]